MGICSSSDDTYDIVVKATTADDPNKLAKDIQNSKLPDKYIEQFDSVIDDIVPSSVDKKTPNSEAREYVIACLRAEHLHYNKYLIEMEK